MSVAFRRESDDEHKEPRFDIPVAPGPNLVTRRGLTLIEEKVAQLDAALAATNDDEARSAVRRELKYWTYRAGSAEVVPPASGEEAAFGTQVAYRDGDDTVSVAIVGGDEADPAAGRIAFSAPLARALIGAAAGETVTFAGRPLTVVAVEPLGDAA